MTLAVRLASYFEPLTFFMPAAGVILVVAVVRGIRDVIVSNVIGTFAALLVVLALQFVAVGILADVVVRRSSGSQASRSRIPRNMSRLYHQRDRTCRCLILKNALRGGAGADILARKSNGLRPITWRMGANENTSC